MELLLTKVLKQQWILFLVVAVGLYVVYTKPSVVPGHREQAVARPIGFTPVVRMPGADRHGDHHQDQRQ